MYDMKEALLNGNTALGIEFGSTRIKAVLVGPDNTPIASGAHDWENQYVDGIWTYSLDAIWTGIQDCYAKMAADVKEKYDVTLTTIGAIGLSAMMHGYMPFNDKDELMVPFRTWRNTITGEAADILTDLFQYNIPQRWSIAHLYQAILNKEEHVKDITFFTTLEGYMHWQLTGEKVLGVGECSGMFPIDIEKKDYNQRMIAQFDELVAEKGFAWKLGEILPKCLVAGEYAGVLTEEGAKKLDVSGNLKPGIPMCPPEGDAGTGMTATNTVAQRTGNVSAGTSVFGMYVLERDLTKVYKEIDLVTTPSGDLVAMVHCNNCTSDINAYVKLFKDFSEAMGFPVDMNKMYTTLFNKALEGDADCGSLMIYPYFSGEHIIELYEGRPVLVRTPNSNFNLANLMKTSLFSCLGVLKTGSDLLFKEEHVEVDSLLGHGGLFKTPIVGQKILAAAMNAPVSVMETAGEGGAWGIALLASYMKNKAEGESLSDWLNAKVFAGNKGSKLDPDPKDVAEFEAFMERFHKGLIIEREAVKNA